MCDIFKFILQIEYIQPDFSSSIFNIKLIGCSYDSSQIVLWQTNLANHNG